MEEWKKVRLGDCIQEINDRTIKNNQYEVLTSSKSGIYSQEEYFDKQVASKDNIGYKIIKRGQFTYRSMSDSGRFTINRLENKEIGIVSPAYPVFEAIKINPVYLKYYFESELFRKAIHNLSQGSTRTALKYKDLSEIEILLPPIKEQERIMKVLEDVSSIIEKNNQILELVKKQKKETMTLILEDSYTWNEKTFEEIFEIKPNNSLSRDKLNYFRGDYKNIHYGDILVKYEEIVDIKENKNVPYINLDENNKLNNCMELSDGDIIIADTAEDETVGKAIEIKNSQGEKVVSGLHTIACRPKLKFANGYLGYYINSNEFHKQLIPLMQGIKVLGITKNNITKRTFIRYPDLNIQSKIVNIMECYSKKEFLLLNQTKKYKKLRHGLMQKLLTGKVRVKI